MDVSSESVKKGIPEAAADAIRSALYGEKGGLPAGAKIAIITFDRNIHFYNLKVCLFFGKCNVKASLDQPQMMVVPDVEDAFVPIQEDFFVDPLDSRYYALRMELTSRVQIELLLSRIELMFGEMHVPEPALGATVETAVSALVLSL